MNDRITPKDKAERRLPLYGVEQELASFEAQRRAELGLPSLDEAQDQWVEEMANISFARHERGDVTLLFGGGMTFAHEYLIEGAVSALGYNVMALDTPDYEALRVGKEFGNRAQCNPTYFTVGNLVKFLIHLRDQKGMSAEDIVKGYVLVTVGACGPCRLGMYVTEYRKALRDAGFDGFRVMFFQQTGGLDQVTGEEAGLDFNRPFFLAILKSIVAGDVINGVGYRLRPYEVDPGATDRAMEAAKRICYDALSRGGSILHALWQVRQEFAKVELDRTRVKPKVSIIGEFWAMTTEGDGNYQLQRFLESEGAECNVQFVTAWLLYTIWEVRYDTASRAELRGADGGRFGLADQGEFGVFSRQAALWAADLALRGTFRVFGDLVGFTDYKLPDMDELAAIAHDHYDNGLRGGEGHMEVGKLIMNVVNQKSTMTVSVKPFGCMPSSGVSDGIQSLITERYPEAIFCAVETSGDGAVNFQSRVQLYLFKAREAAEQEMQAALDEWGLSREEVQAYLAEHPRLARFDAIPRHVGTLSAVDLVHAVGRRLKVPAHRRVIDAVQRAGRNLARQAEPVLNHVPERFRRAFA